MSYIRSKIHFICGHDIGLVLSLMMEAPEDKSVFEKIVAGVTEKEIEFMKIFEIDDGDGTLDSKEFIILTVVRIGAAPPQLINQIHARFAILDRQHAGKISYDNLVLGRAKRTRPRLDSFGQSFKGMLTSFSNSSRGSGLKIRSDSNSSIGCPGDEVAGASPNSAGIRKKPSGATTLSLLNAKLERVNSVKKMKRVGPLGEGPTRISPSNSRSSYSYFNNDIENQYGSPNLETTDTEAFGVVENGDDNCWVSRKFDVDEGQAPKGADSHVESKSSSDVASPCSTQYATVHEVDNNSSSDDESNDVTDCIDDSIGSSGKASSDRKRPKTKRLSSEMAALAWKKMKNLNQSLLESVSVRNPPSQPPPMLDSSKKTLSMSEVVTANTSTKSSSQRSASSSRRALSIAHSFDEIAKSIKNKDVLDKLQKAKELMEAKQQGADESGVHLGVVERSRQTLVAVLNNPYFFCFAAWFLWLLIGTIFYTIHEGISVAKGFYMSVSVGYGIFWVTLKSDNVSRIFTTMHFVVGIFAIALAMAIFARTLISAQKNWYMEAMNKRKFEEAQETEGYIDDIKAAVIYYWPKAKVYVYFWIWAFVGVGFCMGTGQWDFVDSLHFSISAMSTGGFLNIDDDSPNWYFVFVALYVIVGVPVMAIACGLMAHQIANFGNATKLDEKVNAQVTEDELEMMTLLKIEDGDGSIDATEFTILILVRIGALNPDLIGVLYERFDDLDVKNEGMITYDDLQLKHNEGSSGGMKGMVNTGKIHTRLGYG